MGGHDMAPESPPTARGAPAKPGPPVVSTTHLRDSCGTRARRGGAAAGPERLVARRTLGSGARRVRARCLDPRQPLSAALRSFPGRPLALLLHPQARRRWRLGGAVPATSPPAVLDRVAPLAP